MIVLGVIVKNGTKSITVHETNPAKAWNPVSSLQFISSSPFIGALNTFLSYDLIGHLFYLFFFFFWFDLLQPPPFMSS